MLSIVESEEDVPAPASEDSEFGDETGGVIVLTAADLLPSNLMREGWHAYEECFDAASADIRKHIEDVSGSPVRSLVSANAFSVRIGWTDFSKLQKSLDSVVDYVELDLARPARGCDPCLRRETSLDIFQTRSVLSRRTGGLTGAGVKIALLDGGADEHHPKLRIAASHTSGPTDGFADDHATHCAGTIVSQDAALPGIAPEAELFNIKVIALDGSGTHTDIIAGMDEAMRFGAHVVSMSIGYNHLPREIPGGAAWWCDDGRCPLCRAVDNNSTLAVFVIAAGNERRLTAQAIAGGHPVSSQIRCPGQATRAVTVGALSRGTLLPFDTSSQGPTADGRTKPDIMAPGVDVISTLPVHRASGEFDPSLPLFGPMSGSSMATPVVAGVVALLVERRLRQNQRWVDTSRVRGADEFSRDEIVDDLLRATSLVNPALTLVPRLDLEHL